jgi:hypothetical protein
MGVQIQFFQQSHLPAVALVQNKVTHNLIQLQTAVPVVQAVVQDKIVVHLQEQLLVQAIHHP